MLQQGEPFPTLNESVINPDVLSAYVDYRRSCSERSIAIELRQLRHAFRLIFPGLDLGWLLNASKRIASQVAPKPRKHHLVTSERLYLLGLELMDGAIEQSTAAGEVSRECAFQYRDGLIVPLLALIPLRRRTLTALRVGKHLVRAGNPWTLDIPREDTKTDEPLEFLLCETLSRRIDLYLEKFRGSIPNAAKHNGLWVSNKGNPMDDGTIYDMVRRRTRKAFGFGVNLHRFRHAALTFWSIHDPANIRAGKNLLGHRSFGTRILRYRAVACRRTAAVCHRIGPQTPFLSPLAPTKRTYSLQRTRSANGP